MLEGICLATFGILHEVDGASRTLSQALQNIIVEEFLGHEKLFHPGDYLLHKPEWWESGGNRYGTADKGMR
jgi:hypothetical protein